MAGCRSVDAAQREVRYSVDHGGAMLKMADCGFLPLVDRAGMPTLQQVVVTDGAHDGLRGFHDGFAAWADHFIPVPAKPEDPLLRSAGRPIPGARLRVVDPATLQDLPDGQTGGVLIESPGNIIGDGPGNEKFYPAEIENALMQHPDVADGAAIGVPDQQWGGSGKACVVRRPGSTATEREIIDWMRERLAHFKSHAVH